MEKKRIFASVSDFDGQIFDACYDFFKIQEDMSRDNFVSPLEIASSMAEGTTLTIFKPKIRSIVLFVYCIRKASSVMITVSLTR